MTSSSATLWDNCLQRIADIVTPSQYRGFFEPIKFESFDRTNSRLILQVPNPAFKEYLEAHFIEVLKQVIPAVFGPNVSLQYRNIGTVPQTASHTPTDDEAIHESAPQLSSNLNPRYTFKTYVEGESNKLARSISESAAESMSSTRFNPLFIFGPSGCGKTHLINAIGVKTCTVFPKKRVLYVSAREFQRQFTDSHINNKNNDFIAFYQSIDTLIVDDIQEWMGVAGTQNAFFHIFDHLHRSGKRIIMACDRPQSELKEMNERLITRFSMGVTAELNKPNLQLCIDIMHNKISREEGLIIPDEVVNYIARKARGSIRDLEGIINSLQAFSIVYNCDINLDLAHRIVDRTVKDQNPKISPDTIIERICQYFHLNAEDILGPSRKSDYVQARHIAMYFMQKLSRIPHTRIGRLLGNRDHATVNHGITKIEVKIGQSKEFAHMLKDIEANIKK